MGRFAEAVADLDKAIELDPFDDWAFLSRGDAFLELGEAERALADYGQVIELEPENPAGYSHRRDRKSVVSGKSVSVRVYLGGRRIITKKNTEHTTSQLT